MVSLMDLPCFKLLELVQNLNAKLLYCFNRVTNFKLRLKSGSDVSIFFFISSVNALAKNLQSVGDYMAFHARVCTILCRILDACRNHN
jgi:hypothetical protein